MTALEPVETLSLSRSAFADLRRDHPGIDRLLIDVLAAEVRRLSQRLAEALYDNADKRVIRRLLDLDDIYNGVIPLTQDDLATMAGHHAPHGQPGAAGAGVGRPGRPQPRVASRSSTAANWSSRAR